MGNVAYNFNKAAAGYDRSASMQEQVAVRLVALAAAKSPFVKTILDIGSGTGLVTTAAASMWPHARVTALDQAPAMMEQMQKKMPQVKGVVADASTLPDNETYDLILSSMMLHWVRNPAEILRHWQGFLNPQGRLCVALLVEGSFREWGDLCRKNDIENGLWPMPAMNFVDALATEQSLRPLTVTYATAHDFLQRLKKTGAATSRDGYKSVSIATMRHVLASAPQPFSVTYQVLYITMQSEVIV